MSTATLARLVELAASNTVILKLDIEGYECRALAPFLAGNHDVFIPYIFMEWDHIQAPCTHHVWLFGIELTKCRLVLAPFSIP